MPPPPSQKGTGKKGGRDIRQSRSRNTTPSLASTTAEELGNTAYLDLPIAAFKTSDDIVENYGSTIPSSKDLDLLLERLRRLADIIEARGAACDKGMRLTTDARKERLEEMDIERREKERKEIIEQEALDEEVRKINKASKLKKKKEGKEGLPSLGAHGLGPQDGSNRK